MKIENELNLYLENFKWEGFDFNISEEMKRFVLAFFEYWDTEIHNKCLIYGEEKACQSLEFLLENFPELKESSLGLKMRADISTKDDMYLKGVLNMIMMLRVIDAR